MLPKIIVISVMTLIASALFAQPYTSDEWTIPRPDKVDLSVTFIERLPRYPSVSYSYKHLDNDPEIGTGDLLPAVPANTTTKGWPDIGEKVSFIAHVKNVGTLPAIPFDWHWTLDSIETKMGMTSKILAPGEEITFTNYWNWQTGDHYVAFDVNRLSRAQELTDHNNSVIDQINGLSFHFFVEDGLAEWFSTVRNGKGSYCWEDWAQLQVQEMNRTFRDEIHPTTPNGIELRVRLDRIFIIPSGWANPQGMHTPAIAPPINYDNPKILPWNSTNKLAETYSNVNSGCDGVWSFSDGYLEKDPTKGNSNVYERLSHWIQGPEWSLFHELGHQLGLHDFYLTPVSPNQNPVLPGIGHKSSTLFRSQMMHSGNYAHDDNIAKGKDRWDCNYRFWEESAANSLSLDRHRRRGMFGWYIDRMPPSNIFKFVYANGKPVKDATIKFYRSKGRGYTNPSVSATPTYSGTTSNDGSWSMPGPAFTKIFNWGSNGTFLFTLENEAGETLFAWTTYNEFNLEYYRGKKIGQYILMVEKLKDNN